jgi:hypothetical protein
VDNGVERQTTAPPNSSPGFVSLNDGTRAGKPYSHTLLPGSEEMDRKFNAAKSATNEGSLRKSHRRNG